MTRRALLIGLAALVAAASTALWLRHRAGSQPPTLRQRAERASLEGRPFPAGVRYPTLAPFAGTWGASIDLDRWLGKRPLVVSVWASWCAPCKREAPLLQAAWQAHGRNVQFVGIDFRDLPSDGAGFARTEGMTYPSGSDRRGTAKDSLHVLGLPTTFFIDRAGRIVDERIGELDARQLARGLRAIEPDTAGSSTASPTVSTNGRSSSKRQPGAQRAAVQR